jgi:hypothetical protein
MILGVLGPQQSVILSPRAKPTDRSTFCPMPGGRFQAASDAIRTEAVALVEEKVLTGARTTLEVSAKAGISPLRRRAAGPGTGPKGTSLLLHDCRGFPGRCRICLCHLTGG